MNLARINSLHIVPNRDIDLFEHSKKIFENVIAYTPRFKIEVEGNSNLLVADDVFALSSPIQCKEVASVNIVLLANEEAADMVLEASYPIFIEEVALGDEERWLRELKKTQKSKSKTPPAEQYCKLNVLTENKRIFAHIEYLKKKEIVHRYNNIIYSVPTSRRGKIRNKFAEFIAGVMPHKEFKELVGANETSLEHLRDVDDFLSQNPNYKKAYSMLLKVMKDGNPTPREIRLIADETDVPTFELSYFSISKKND